MQTGDEPPDDLPPHTEARLSRDTSIRLGLALAGLVAAVVVLVYLLAPAVMR